MTSLTWGPPAVRARSVLGFAVAVVIAFAAMALVATPAEAQVRVGDTSAEDCSNEVDVQVQAGQEACAETLAVSVQGDAQSSGACSDQVGCIAISGTGDASTGTASSASGPGPNTGRCGYTSSPADDPGSRNPGVGVSCIAVSGTGNASNGADNFNDACGTGGWASVAVGCVAVSGTGNASNDSNVVGNSCGMSRQFFFGVPGVAVGCIAVSGTGNASNTTDGHTSCGSRAIGCVAVSGTGDASNTYTANASGCGSDVGCVAISGTGDASNDVENGCAIAGHAVAVGCIAVTGSSSGTASNTTGPGEPCGTAHPSDPDAAVDHLTNPPTHPIDLLFWLLETPQEVQQVVPGMAVGCVEVNGPLP